jgi:hypothetical protein
MLGLSLAAYAEVQNVKVSGDLLMRAIGRNNFTLNTDNNKYSARGITAQARLRVDADLTDNVSTTIRLLSERSWGDEYNPMDEVMSDGYEVDGFMYSDSGSSMDIDLAYVTLKEFLYSPLTLTIGRQELRFGNALIIGDVDTNMLSNSYAIPLDLSLKKSFDAIRATLDYKPWTIDLVYSKIAEHDTWWAQNLVGGPSGEAENNDTDLWGINASLDTTNVLGFEGTLDLYYWLRLNKLNWAQDTDASKDECNTVGGLLSGKILKNLTGSLEYAYQFGKLTYDPTGLNDDNAQRRAFAAQASLKYLIETQNADFNAKSPAVGISYSYLSGDNREDTRAKMWDPMFEDQTPNNIFNALFPNTGTQNINLMGSMKPTEDTTLAINVGMYWLSVKPKNGAFIPAIYGSSPPPEDAWTIEPNKDTSLGTALDLTATYDYTEDVQFGLTFGMFAAGEVLKDSHFGNHPDGYEGTATQLIGSMKVTF